MNNGNYWKKFYATFIVDIASFGLIYASFSFFLFLFNDSVQKVQLTGDVFSVGAEKVQQLALEFPKLYGYLICLVVLALLIAIALLSVSRALIWRFNFNKKIDAKYILKSVLVGLIWYVINIIIGAVFYFVIIEPYNLYLTAIYSLVAVYLSSIVFMEYSLNNKFNIIKLALKKGVDKKLALSYVLLSIGFILLLTIAYMVGYLITLRWLFAYLLAVIILVFAFFSYSRLVLLKKRG